MLIAASSPSTRFFVPRRRAVRAPRHDPPPPPESNGSNGPLSRPLRAGGGHPGCQLYRVVHSRSEATRTCQYGRLRQPCQVVVQSDLTAAAGQTRPAPSPDMPAGHVRWATRVLWLGYDAQRPPQCHNQPHMPDQRPCEPHYRSRARAVAALVGLGRAGVHFDRLGQRRAMVRDFIGLVID